jgi:hypothetical protein
MPEFVTFKEPKKRNGFRQVGKNPVLLKMFTNTGAFFSSSRLVIDILRSILPREHFRDHFWDACVLQTSYDFLLQKIH